MPEHDIAIITDSTCDIPTELIAKYDITIVPHTIIWDDQPLLDRVDIQPEEFYRRIKNGASIPTTSQATEQDYLQAFKKAIINGAQEILVNITPPVLGINTGPGALALAGCSED